MFRLRGLIALFISIVLGLFVAMAAWVYLKKSPPNAETERPVQPLVVPSPPKTFAQGIPEGMRAFTVRVDDLSGVTRKLRKGDRVDVLAIHSVTEKGAGNLARMILQHVEIYDLSLSTDPEGQASRREKGWTVSLLLTPKQGAMLAAAEASATIRLLARNANESEHTAAQPMAYFLDRGLMEVNQPAGNIQNLISPGMRAISLIIRETDGILGNLNKGDRVDVMLSTRASQFAIGQDANPGGIAELTGEKKSSRILLQDIEVLATEKTLRMDGETNKTIRRVSLHVTPQQAETLAVVADTGKSTFLRLLSRNNRDEQRVKTGGQDLQELVSQKRETHHVSVIRADKPSKVILYK